MRQNLQKSSVIGVMALVVLLGSMALLRADPGDLDLTFGNGNGYVTTDITTEDRGVDMVIDSSGRILVVVQEYAEPSLTGLVIRYNPDGTLDTSFGNGGIVSLPFGLDSVTYVHELALDGNGKIIVSASNNTGLGMIRLNPDGSVDIGFGNQGAVSDGVGILSIGADNKITFSQSDGTGNVHLVRYDANGILDTTFGDEGITPDVLIHSPASLIPDVDGSLVIVGKQISSNSVAQAKYTSSGDLDTTFGNNGLILSDLGETAIASGTRDQAGRIVLTGDITDYSGGLPYGVQHVTLIRYLPDGTLDPTFGENGIVITKNVQDGSSGFRILIDTSGRIIVVGSSQERFESPYHYVFSIFIARYNPDGSLDSTFGGGDGITLWNPGSEPAEGYDYYNFADDAVLDANGRVVITGETGWNDPNYITGVSDILLARFEDDFPVIPTATPPATDTSVPTQTPTSLETPTTEPTESETPTATETPPSGIDLIVNGGFEASNGSLDGWQGKRLTRDQVKCNKDGKPPVAYEGNCAFRFKGGAGENSQIFQKPEIVGMTFAAGDIFTLQAQIHAKGLIAFKAQASLTYSDGTQGKIKLDLTPADASDGYVLHSGDYMLTGSDVTKVKVMLKNKSTSGKIDVDDVRLTVAAGTSVIRALP